MSKAITNKDNGSKISLKGAEELRDSINLGLKALTKGYIAIMPQFNKLYDTKGFRALGYKNIDDCAKFEFGMSHGMVVGLRKVWDLIGTVTVNNEYIIPDKYSEWGYTQLLCIATNKAQFEEANIKPFEVFTPDMTVRAMAATLKSTLADKTSEQDNNAIDVTEDSATAEEPNAEEPKSEEPKSNNDVDTPIEIIENMIITVGVLRTEFEGKVKAERLALLDAIEANLKDFKKEVKKIK